LTTIVRIASLRLSQNVQTTHTQFKTPMCGYLFVLPQPSEVLETLKYAHVTIIDEMSMMTNVMLCAIEECLK
jgi:hypothetical protein